MFSTVDLQVMASLQAAEGKPLHIALLPSEMMAEFRAHNPDMEDVLDEALNRNETKLGARVFLMRILM